MTLHLRLTNCFQTQPIRAKRINHAFACTPGLSQQGRTVQLGLSQRGRTLQRAR